MSTELKTVAWLLDFLDGSQETWFTDPVGVLDPRWSDIPVRVRDVVLRSEAEAEIARLRAALVLAVDDLEVHRSNAHCGLQEHLVEAIANARAALNPGEQHGG